MAMWRITTTMTGVAVPGGGINQAYFSSLGSGASAAGTAQLAFWAAFASVLAGVTFVVEPEAEEVDEVTGEITDVAAITGGTTAGGGSTTDLLPTQSQLLVRWRTGTFRDGSEVRGRTFIPGCLEGSSTSGVPTAALVGVAQAAADTLAGHAAELVIWRRPRAHRPAIGPGPGHPHGLPELAARLGSYDSVVSASVWNKWAILRSRRD